MLWTSDGGRDWKDITPSETKDSVISTTFFSTPVKGGYCLRTANLAFQGGLHFDLASTDDGGSTWSEKQVAVPARKYSGSDILNGGILAFADPLHGWLGLTAGMSTAFRGTGVLLTTSDGGSTWKLATAHGWGKYDVIGPMLMVTPDWGWLVGGGDSAPLYVTRDGGKTWQRVVLESPVKTGQMKEYDQKSEQWKRGFERAISPAEAKLASRWMSGQQPTTYAAYDLPTFKDPEHDHICVTYPGVVVLFATSDGGVTWKPDRIVTGLHPHQTGTRVASAVADSGWIIGRAARNSMPQLTKLGPGARVTDNSMPAPEASGVSQMSFVTPKQGWVLTFNDRLLSTNDGGATWTDITPGRKPPTVAP